MYHNLLLIFHYQVRLKVPHGVSCKLDLVRFILFVKTLLTRPHRLSFGPSITGRGVLFSRDCKWFKINCDNIVTISCLTRQCNFSNGHLISHIAHCWSLNGQYASKKVATWNECPSCAWCRVQMASISISGPGFIFTVTCNIVTCWGDARRNDWSALWQCNWAFKTLQTI